MTDADEEAAATARREAERQRQKENDTYVRIARHNGTTVEEERAKAERGKPTLRERLAADTAAGQPPSERELRARLGAKDVDDDPGSSAESGSAVSTLEPANPYVNGLVGIYVVAFLIGLILTIVGAANASSYSPGEFSDHTDNGIGEIVTGGGFLDLGIVAVVVHVGVSAVLWQLRRKA